MGARGEDFDCGSVVARFEVALRDDAELLVGFVVLAFGDAIVIVSLEARQGEACRYRFSRRARVFSTFWEAMVGAWGELWREVAELL